MLKCFHSDELFQQIVRNITDEVVQKLNSKSEQQKELQEIYDLTLEGQKQQSSNLQKMIADKRQRESVDPEKLVLKVNKLQSKLEKQTKDYFTELDIYRNQLRKSTGGKGSQGGGLMGLREQLRKSDGIFEVRLFDECDQIPEEHLALMNQKIADIQSQYSQYVQNQMQTQKTLLIKLHAFEKLKPEQYSLIDLTLDEIIQALPALETDPQILWNLIEKHYRPNFFDNEIFKKYGYLFENRNESEFIDQMKIIREEIKEEMCQLARQYENEIRQIKADYREKVCEIYELKDKYQLAYENAYKEASENAQLQYEERERLIFNRWEVERAGLMDEQVELEKSYAHFDVQLAQEKFRSFVFRWTVFNKVSKMKKFDRESYEFMKANVEVQEMLKVDIDFRIQVAIQVEKQKRDKFRDDYYRVLGDICDIRFQNSNLKRLLTQKDKLITEMNNQDHVLSNNLKFAKEKIVKLEDRVSVLNHDNQNQRDMVKSLESKYQQLSNKLEKIKDQQNMSILDMKQVFGATDKTLSKTRLIDEINEVVKKMQKKMRKQSNNNTTQQMQQKDTKHQIIGTDLRNVTKDICYRIEYGEGILVHQDTQMERVIMLGRECQTDETLLKSALKRIQIENIDRDGLQTSERTFSNQRNQKQNNLSSKNQNDPA